jgi:hypothetical protein
MKTVTYTPIMGMFASVHVELIDCLLSPEPRVWTAIGDGEEWQKHPDRRSAKRAFEGPYVFSTPNSPVF